MEEKIYNKFGLCLFEILKNCKQSPDKKFFTYEEENVKSEFLTGETLVQKTEILGSILQQHVKPQGKAILLLPQGLAYIYGLTACWYANIVAIPFSVHSRVPKEQDIENISRILKDSKADCIITNSNFKEFLHTKDVAGFVSILNVDELPDCSGVVGARLQGPEDLALLLYTSGSTSQPKGVMINHRTLMYQAASPRWRVNSNSRVVAWISQSHAFGLNFAILGPLLHGATCVLLSPSSFLMNPEYWFRMIDKYKATQTGAPSFAFDYCCSTIDSSAVENISLHSLQAIVCSGEFIRKQTYENFLAKFGALGIDERIFCPLYGLSELCPVTSKAPGESIRCLSLEINGLKENKIRHTDLEDRRFITSCGEIEEPNKIIIVNPETCELCAPDEIGEIWIKSPAKASGYLNREKETESTFWGILKDTKEEGFFRSGDLGFIEDNNLYVVGREKEVIIIHGKNHYSVDIESTLKKHLPELTLPGAVFSYEIDDQERVVVFQEIDTLISVDEYKKITQKMLGAVSKIHGIEIYEIDLFKEGDLPRTTGVTKGQRKVWRTLYAKQELRPIFRYWRGNYELQSQPREQIPLSENQKGFHPDSSAELVQRTRQYLVKIFSELMEISSNQLELNTPLENYGIDSLLITKLNLRIARDVGDVSKTLFFEVRTLSETALYLVAHHAPRLEAFFRGSEVVEDFASAPPATSMASSRRDGANVPGESAKYDYGVCADLAQGDAEIAIIGLSGRYPMAKNPAEFWDNLAFGRDCITEIPSDRWDYRRIYNPDIKKSGSSYCKWGGFIEGFAQFDPLFFNISPNEAAMTNPQERLFLQIAWEVMEDAGYTRTALKENYQGNVGVFVGTMYAEYQYYAVERSLRGENIAFNTSYGSIANRVSYFLDLNGPSMAIDTFCSSSFTALHLAAESIRRGECKMAIVGGVNLNLHPNKYLWISQLKMASAQGYCKPFGKGGDGFVPGEGVGAVLLKPLDVARADNDHIYAVIKSTAINHNGKTNGYTVPSPQLQADLIQTALKRARIDTRTISYVEAHGTGTSLGDPIEIEGLTRAFRKHTQDRQFCAVGSVKSNIGHLEAASGIAALTKVLLQMKHKKLVPSIHTEELNENIRFEDSPFYVQRELASWERPFAQVNGDRVFYPRRAGISSFGAGGVNAHIIIEEYQNQAPVSEICHPTPQIILLSAKNEARLTAGANQLYDFICNNGDIRLIDVAYTLQVGREPMEERLALLASDLEDLRKKLKAFRQGKKDIEDLYLWNSRSHVGDYSFLLEGAEGEAFIRQLIQNRNLLKLIQLWGAGVHIDWKELHWNCHPRRVSLPTYPFETNRYWLPEVDKIIASDKNRAKLLFEHETLPRLSSDSSQPVKSPESYPDIQYYTREWKEKTPDKLASREIANERDILIFGDDDGLFDTLQRKLSTSRIVRVKSGRSFCCENDGLFHIDPAKPEDYERLFSELEKSGISLSSIIHYWSSERFNGSNKSVKQQLTQSVYSIFCICRALFSLSLEKDEKRVRLLYVFESDPDGGQPFYEAVCGLARSIQLETTRLKFQTLEFAIPRDALGTPVDVLAQVVSENLGSPGEDYNELKYLNGKLLISGLREWTPGSLKTGERSEFIPFRENGLYLVTGGAGGLGLIFSRYLIQEHRAKVVLVGRSEKNSAILEKLNRIDPHQGQAVYYRADISREEQVESLISDIKAQYGEINGVFHCAGVIKDALVYRKGLENVNEILAPKVQGTIYLDKFLWKENLDFFILFSSAISQLGNIGQSDYAYANSFLDSFAKWREWMRSQGRRHGQTVSIGWPLWENGGIAVDENSRLRFKRAWGMSPLSTEDGLKAGETIIREGLSQVMVMAGDSAKFRQSLPLAAVQQTGQEMTSKKPFLATGEKETVTPAPFDLNEINQFLREQVSVITGIALEEVDDEAEFWDIGIDSILAMQILEAIADRFGLRLYPTELLRYNTIKTLSAYTGQELVRSKVNEVAVSKSATPRLCFILSTPRAGSTLLRVMLMGHSRIFAPPELHLLHFDSLGERKKNLTQSNQAFLREGLIETIKVLEDIDTGKALEIMEELENKDVSIAETYRYLTGKVGDRILVDKSPTYGEHLDTLRKAETMGFKPFYIFLVRHPLSMMASFVNNRFDRMLNIREEPWQYSKQLWVKINANIIRFLTDIPNDRKMLIRFEDLVSASEQTMREICNRLDLSFENEMLKPYQGERMTHGLHQQSITIGDPGFLRHKAIMPELADAWKSHANRLKELELATIKLARELGYTLEADDSGGAELPLSPAQQSIFNRLGPHPHWGVVEHLRIRLNEPLDLARFNESLKKVVKKHSVLSYSFIERNKTFIQCARESAELCLDYRELSSCAAEDIGTRLKEAESELIGRLRIETAPLMAICAAALGNNEYAVVAVFHMLIADGRTCEIILEDIFRYYYDSKATVLPVDTRFADYMACIEKMKKDHVEDNYLQLWLDEVKGGTTRIPYDYNEKSIKGEPVEIYYETFTFEELLINNQVGKGKVFLYFSVGLYRYLSTLTGQMRPIITHRFHRRNLAEIGSYFDVAGRFAGDVPLRLTVSPKGSTKTLISSFQKRYSEIPHQGLTYEILANDGKVPTAAESAPILLNFQYGYPRIPLMTKCKWHQYEDASDAQPYDIDLIVRVRMDSIRVIVKYPGKRYKHQTIEKHLRSWIATVRDIIAEDTNYTVPDMFADNS
ncbi:malonyl CoA-acyl carrier protein transacylase [Desulfocucumis palustris]|uniref:Malonyl CoA-acyl carrier protein transacylase n=1 Tax=Desulfocucumis palustris TaxID=1898651 RepID=A0A2L2XEY9_9FIRM|nr:SDR family NAD(P)-dependent oxidoreductase [Desulfocucumis palustris]GBF34808.1 malonyl CoA-acyl carrier protein transacylase [Desulfocucumis palustris]